MRMVAQECRFTDTLSTRIVLRSDAGSLELKQQNIIPITKPIQTILTISHTRGSDNDLTISISLS